jgi:hypothetical protein
MLFHVPYDDVSLDHINELDQRTREVIADGDHGRLTLTQSRQFLQQCRAQVGVLRARKSLNKDALRCLDAVDQSYAALEQRKAPIRTSNTVELCNALDNLHGLGLEHGVWMAHPPPPSSLDSGVIDTPDTTAQKNCDHGKDCDSHSGKR